MNNKILVITEGISQDFTGGAQTYIKNITDYLNNNGNEIYIITRKQQKNHPTFEKINGKNVYRYNSIERGSKFYKLYPLYSIINSKKTFEDLCPKINFDIINFHFPFPALGILLSKDSKDKKKVYTFHAPTSEEILLDNKNNKFVKNIITPIVNKIERFVLTRCDEIIVLSKFMKNKLLSIHENINPKKIHIIPGGVDINYFSPVAANKDNRKFKKEESANSESIIFFTARRLVERMGLKNLILAFKKLSETHSNITLYIAGKGYLADELSDLIDKYNLRKDIKLLGFISDEELLSYYRTADYFILPTEKLEGFGLVTLEAMACGTPVIATPVGGSVEILTNFNNNFLFDSASVDDMYLKIKELIDNYSREKIESYSRKARSFIVNNYSWEEIIKDVERIFDNTNI